MAVKFSHTETSQICIDFIVKCLSYNFCSEKILNVLIVGPLCNCVLELLGNCLETFWSCLDVWMDGLELGFPAVCTFYSVLDTLIKVYMDGWGVQENGEDTQQSSLGSAPIQSSFVRPEHI